MKTTVASKSSKSSKSATATVAAAPKASKKTAPKARASEPKLHSKAWVDEAVRATLADQDAVRAAAAPAAPVVGAGPTTDEVRDALAGLIVDGPVAAAAAPAPAPAAALPVTMRRKHFERLNALLPVIGMPACRVGVPLPTVQEVAACESRLPAASVSDATRDAVLEILALLTTTSPKAPKAAAKAAPVAAPAPAAKSKAKAPATAAKASADVKAQLGVLIAGVKAKASTAPAAQYAHDDRVPAVGSVIEKLYRPRGGEPRTLRVTVLADGFRFGGKHYTSLSALATELCGGVNHNGLKFFGLTK